MWWGQGADMFDAWGQGRDWQLINCLNARVLSQHVCYIPNNKAELPSGGTKGQNNDTLTLARASQGEECGPDTLASALSRGVCRVSPAEQTSHIIIIRSSFLFITTYNLTNTQLGIKASGFLSTQDGQFLCMKLAWHLTRCWCSPHYAALQAVSLKSPIKTYQTEWKYVPHRFYQ